MNAEGDIAKRGGIGPVEMGSFGGCIWGIGGGPSWRVKGTYWSALGPDLLSFYGVIYVGNRPIRSGPSATNNRL